MNKEINFRRICVLYFKERIAQLIKLIIYIFIFIFILFLYNKSIEPIKYALLLVSTIEFIYIIIDIIKFYERYKLLINIKENIDMGIEKLPSGRNAIEDEYSNIIRKIYDENNNLKGFYDNEYVEMIDYYTMWIHQIKTPISSLSMIIQSMETKDLKYNMEEQLFKIQQYVEMVLQYIRIGNLSSDLELKRCSLKKIVNACIKKYSINFIHKKIKLNIDNIDTNVLTDEKWISFVIEQVLSNALKYTKDGSISINMKDKILIIEDTGIGIAAEDIPRVFEKGFTGYNGRINKKSTGIGLYLCKRIVDNLSHKINIESEIGKGTRVMIDFSTDCIEIE